MLTLTHTYIHTYMVSRCLQISSPGRMRSAHRMSSDTTPSKRYCHIHVCVCMYVCMCSGDRNHCMYVCMYVRRWLVSSSRTWTSADSTMRWIMQCAETSATTCPSCKSLTIYVCMYILIIYYIHTYM